MFPSFDMDGKPAASYAEIGRRFDRRYRVRERKDDPFPPDMRGKNNPEREHCSPKSVYAFIKSS